MVKQISVGQIGDRVGICYSWGSKKYVIEVNVFGVGGSREIRVKMEEKERPGTIQKL